MPKLKTFFNSEDLILQIKISNHVLAQANIDIKKFEEICELDKDPSLVSQLKAILATVDLLEKIEKEGPENIIFNLYGIPPSNQGGPYVSYSTSIPYANPLQNTNPLAYYAQNLANVAAQTNQQKGPPPHQPIRFKPFKPFNHCPSCKKRNPWGIYNCEKCGVDLRSHDRYNK